VFCGLLQGASHMGWLYSACALWYLLPFLHGSMKSGCLQVGISIMWLLNAPAMWMGAESFDIRIGALDIIEMRLSMESRFLRSGVFSGISSPSTVPRLGSFLPWIFSVMSFPMITGLCPFLISPLMILFQYRAGNVLDAQLRPGCIRIVSSGL